MQKVVITGNIGVVTPEIFERYQSYIKGKVENVEVEFIEDMPISDEELVERAKGATIIVSQFQEMNEKVYKELKPELKAFMAHGIGTNAADVKTATENGILVSNVPDYCLEEVANHTVSLILSSYRKIPMLDKHVRKGKWAGGHHIIEDKIRFSEYTIGLYGFGNIPRRVSKMLLGFGVKIIANDPYVSKEEMEKLGVKSVTFEELLEKSDFISLHTPLLKETEGVFDKEAFKKMKTSACLINTARGGLVNPEDLYNALLDEEIGFAAIDAFISEPPLGIEKKFLDLDNTIITPHVGYYSKTAFNELLCKVSEGIVDILSNRLPKYVVNPEVVNKLDWIK